MKIVSSSREITTQELLTLSEIIHKDPSMRLRKVTTHEPTSTREVVVKTLMDRIQNTLSVRTLKCYTAELTLSLSYTKTKVPHPLNTQRVHRESAPPRPRTFKAAVLIWYPSRTTNLDNLLPPIDAEIFTDNSD
jgi:hypothetical protein